MEAWTGAHPNCQRRKLHKNNKVRTRVSTGPGAMFNRDRLDIAGPLAPVVIPTSLPLAAGAPRDLRPETTPKPRVNNRLMTIRLALHESKFVTVINAHASPKTSADDVKDKFAKTYTPS
ncbi:hypothetical protein SprV_0301168900 [Sparganum proliferum]